MINLLYPAFSDQGKMIPKEWLPERCQLVENVNQLPEVSSTLRDSQEAINSEFTLEESSLDEEDDVEIISNDESNYPPVDLTSDEEMDDSDPENE